MLPKVILQLQLRSSKIGRWKMLYCKQERSVTVTRVNIFQSFTVFTSIMSFATFFLLFFCHLDAQIFMEFIEEVYVTFPIFTSYVNNFFS